MGWFGFGGGSSGDTSGSSSSSSSLDLSSYGGGDDSFGGSKKRSSISEFDLDSSSASSGFDLGSSASSDVQTVIQAEQQKMQLMTAVRKCLNWRNNLETLFNSKTLNFFFAI